jgi:hypothetical protein
MKDMFPFVFDEKVGLSFYAMRGIQASTRRLQAQDRKRRLGVAT